MHVIGKYDTAGARKRVAALNRARELKGQISDYLEQKDLIKTGFDLQGAIRLNKERILKHFHAGEKDWQNWQWQMTHRINDVSVLETIFNLNKKKCAQIRTVGKRYRWAISPYYASLMDASKLKTVDDPVMLQSVPSIEEMNDAGSDDPMAEQLTSPAPCITRRYPDRLIINVTNQCAMYCRHCQRRRNIGEVDRHHSHPGMVAALEYINENKEIRDVLITGGDALLLSDSKIDWLLSELERIKHVEIKRLGTRTIVTLPQRITPELCAVLKKHPPIYINTQFNHPQEITPESKRACDLLIQAGVVLGNQAVLLKGINDNPHVMKKLNQELLKIRVKPYYIFHAKPVKGTNHFITSVDAGIAVMENLRGYTSGLAVPYYIINAPNGYGKTPVLPQYVVGRNSNTVQLRTWENRVMEYACLPEDEPDDYAG